MTRLINPQNTQFEINHNILDEAYKKLIGDFYHSFRCIDNKYVYFEGYVKIMNYKYKVSCAVPLSELPEKKIYRLPPSIGIKYAIYTLEM